MQSAEVRDRVLTEYAKMSIRVKARQLTRRSEFNRSDREDLEQELWLALLSQADQYDPQRASLHTFIDRVVGAAAKMLLRDRRRQKRVPGQATVSLDRTLVHRTGQPKRPLRQLLLDADLSRRTGAVRPDETARCEDAKAVARALDAMPEDMRDVCHRVMVGSISATARQMAISRHQVRKVLQTAGPYLQQAGCGDEIFNFFRQRGSKRHK